MLNFTTKAVEIHHKNHQFSISPQKLLKLHHKNHQYSISPQNCQNFNRATLFQNLTTKLLKLHHKNKFFTISSNQQNLMSNSLSLLKTNRNKFKVPVLTNYPKSKQKFRTQNNCQVKLQQNMTRILTLSFAFHVVVFEKLQSPRRMPQSNNENFTSLTFMIMFKYFPGFWYTKIN